MDTRPCGKGARQAISVPDYGARIKAIETSLREGIGRVGEEQVPGPRTPTSVAELRTLSSEELELVVAVGYTTEIRDVLDHGDDALRSNLASWEPETREIFARALAEVARASVTIYIGLTRRYVSLDPCFGA